MYFFHDSANASNSLIGMWVLQPSILDLLAVRLIPQTTGRVGSSLFFTQLYLLYSHCSRYSGCKQSSITITLPNTVLRDIVILNNIVVT